MAMTNRMYVNLSGRTIPLIEASSGRKVGDIYNREVFCVFGSEGSLVNIDFLGPDGKMTNVFIQDLDLPASFYTPITDRHSNYYTMADGKNYHIFDMRRQEEVYKADGSRWGSVAAGARVACSDDRVGREHPDWKQVEYVSSGNTWIRVEGNGSNWGFVDTGMAISSMPNQISMYGTW